MEIKRERKRSAAGDAINTFAICAVLMLSVFLTNGSAQDVCWKNTIGRGSGKIGTVCSGEKVGALCYPKCRTGYIGRGAICDKPADSYSRGRGTRSSYNRKTRTRYCTGGKELSGGLCYTPCRAGYSGSATICRKAGDRYTRGAGEPMKCAPGMEFNQGLCYNACPSGYRGIGPACWQQCSGTFGTNCGALCARSAAACKSAVIEMVVKTGVMTLNVSALIASAGAAGPAVAVGQQVAKSVGGKVAVEVGKAVAVKKAKEWLIKGQQESGQPSMTEDALNMAAEALVNSKRAGEFDYTALDPTGIAAVVRAFNQPNCSKVN
ncbi:MAG: hypothetical protein R2681_17635 [Pyrinomonadaceae bacterium]